jgi:starch synthase
MHEQFYRVLMVSAEVAPLAKVGGLADVAGALPKALLALGHDTRILMPAYPMIEADTRWQIEPLTEFQVAVRPGWTETATVFHLTLPSGVRVYLLRVGDWFANATESTKLYAVDPRAYVAFCRAAVEWLARQSDWTPQVVHCNDWHTALVPVYLRTYRTERTDAMATVFTIHNLAYQGVFEKEFFGELGLPDYLFDVEGLEFYGKVNLMKGALLYSDRVNTVSPTYAAEIQTPEYGERLEGLLRRLADERRLSGILNGIDYDEWNPETDPHIPAHYSATNLQGKATCKAELQQRVRLAARPQQSGDWAGLAPDRPERTGFNQVAGRETATVADSVCVAGHRRPRLRTLFPLAAQASSREGTRDHRLRQWMGAPNLRRRGYVPDALAV